MGCRNACVPDARSAAANAVLVEIGVRKFYKRRAEWAAAHSAAKIRKGGAAEILDGLSSEPDISTMLDGAAGTQRDLDPRLVVPADVEVQSRHELVDGRGQPVARVEQLGLQATEEAFASCVVW